MRSLALKIMEVFVYKYEKKFLNGNFNVRGGGGIGSLNSTFDSALSLVFEDTLVEWVKMIFIELNSQNIMTPWIYLFYNNDFQQVRPCLLIYK